MMAELPGQVFNMEQMLGGGRRGRMAYIGNPLRRNIDYLPGAERDLDNLF